MVRIKREELLYLCQFKLSCHLKEPKAHSHLDFRTEAQQN